MSLEMIQRTLEFSLMVLRLTRLIPKNEEVRVITHQLLKSATSVGANYRSAFRGKSKADFIMKLKIAEEEADESCYWLELLLKSGLGEERLVISVLHEARQITAIITASVQTAKRNLTAR